MTEELALHVKHYEKLLCVFYKPAKRWKAKQKNAEIPEALVGMESLFKPTSGVFNHFRIEVLYLI